jgi:hypothetical protein
MKTIAIKQYENALPALRAVQILRNQGVAASARPQFTVQVPTENNAIDGLHDMLQPFQSHDYDFTYKGPRPRLGMAYNIVDPADAQMLATLLDQSAVLAALGSLFVDGRPAAPLFGGLAQQIRDQSAYDHGNPDAESTGPQA